MTEESSPADVAAEEPWTVRRILEWTTAYLEKNGSETARLDAEILLAHARGCQRIELYTRFHEQLTNSDRDAMRSLVRRRANAEPVAYLVGFREFFSLDFRVTPDVLIPRPDTETLVIELLERLKPVAEPTLLEIGTGSGCIAIAAAKNNARVQVAATDISPAALQIAQENARTLAVDDRIAFLEGDLFAPVNAASRFDVIVSNPPYIRLDEMETLQPDVRLHEPHSALVAGADGLDIIRRLVSQASQFLKPGGHLLLEIDPAQAEPVARLIEAEKSFDTIRFCKDIAGRQRVVCAASSE